MELPVGLRPVDLEWIFIKTSNLLSKAHPKLWREKSVLGIGIGSTLGVELLIKLAGAKKVVGNDWLDTVSKDQNIYDALKESALKRLPDFVEKSRGGPASLEEISELFDNPFISKKVEYQPNVDMTKTLYKSGEFDIVYSHATIEHFRSPVACILEMARVCKPGGFQVHCIDFGDHRLGVSNRNIDHLKCNEDEWMKLQDTVNNSTYVNRMRFSEVLEIMTNEGLSVVFVNQQRCKIANNFTRIDLSPDFRGISEDDLTTIGCEMVSVKNKPLPDNYLYKQIKSFKRGGDVRKARFIEQEIELRNIPKK